jgi:hypothetical protein
MLYFMGRLIGVDRQHFFALYQDFQTYYSPFDQPKTGLKN